MRLEQTQAVLETANDTTTHWRYAIVAVRVLRTLLRRDTPISSSHLRLFLEKVCDSNPTMVRSCGLLGPCKVVDIFVDISAT
jgi:proteasome activator subunit 4